MSRLRLTFFFFRSISAISWLASASAELYEAPLILNKPKLLPELSSERFCDTVCTASSLSCRIVVCLLLKSSSKAFRPNWLSIFI